MTETKNNHYIPQLLIRRFGERVNSYNIHTEEIQENVKTKNVFCEKRFYSQELEELLAKHIEGPFGDLLNNKILSSKNELKLTREEVLLLKKYIVVCWLRTPAYIDSKETVDICSQFLDEFYGDSYEDCTAEESFEKDLKELIFAKNDLFKLAENTKSSTLRHLVYAISVSYFSFWDSIKSGEDFIITDNPFITNIGYTPPGFMAVHITSNLFKMHPLHAGAMMNATTKMGDYYFMFPVSKTRMIVMCHPFMKFFDMEGEYSYLGLPEFTVNDVCGITTRTLFTAPKSTRDNQLKTYRIQYLSMEDVMFNNTLLLEETFRTIVFSDFNKIQSSIELYQRTIGVSKNYDSLLKQYK